MFSSLLIRFAELEHYTSLPVQPIQAGLCDVVVNRPTLFMKLDAGVFNTLFRDNLFYGYQQCSCAMMKLLNVMTVFSTVIRWRYIYYIYLIIDKEIFSSYYCKYFKINVAPSYLIKSKTIANRSYHSHSFSPQVLIGWTTRPNCPCPLCQSDHIGFGFAILIDN